jgi:hypothetical protein
MKSLRNEWEKVKIDTLIKKTEIAEIPQIIDKMIAIIDSCMAFEEQVINGIDEIQKKYEPRYGTDDWGKYRGGVYDGLEALKHKLFSDDEINE